LDGRKWDFSFLSEILFCTPEELFPPSLIPHSGPRTPALCDRSEKAIGAGFFFEQLVFIVLHLLRSII